jgi:hypothetical protein
VLGLSNFLTLQTFRARQNHLFRTTARLSRENDLNIRVSLRKVPQGRHTLAHRGNGGKTSTNCKKPRRGATQLFRALPHRNQLSVLNSAHTKMAPATLVESALPFLLDLKVFGISTYKNIFGGHPLMNQNHRSGNGSLVARVALAFISGQ